MNLIDNLLSHSRARPSHIALIQGARSLTYSELAVTVARSASQMSEHGIRPGDIVGTSLNDDIDHVIALHALAMLGAIILPLDIRWHISETERVASRFNAKFVLSEDGQVGGKRTERIALDESWHAAAVLAPALRRFPRARGMPLALSLSSGTTGIPRGPLITHENMLARFQGHWVTLGFCQHDRFLLATPLYYGGGRGFTMSYLYIGATVILFPPPFKPNDLLTAVEQHQPTTAFMVPTQLLRLLDIASEDGKPLFDKLRTLVSSGSTLVPSQRRAIRKKITKNFFDYYSSTEGGGVSVQTPVGQDIHPESVGQPIHRVEVEIVDDNDRRVDRGEIGRIRYRGPGVPHGFFDDLPGTSPNRLGAFFQDGYFYPGDLGHLNSDGYLFLRGRIKDVIIRGGINIYPSDIEEVLRSHPSVVDVAAVGWPSPELGEEVAAFVVRSEPELDEQILIHHCQLSLAKFKVPKSVIFINELPRNAGGKVIKKELIGMLPEPIDS